MVKVQVRTEIKAWTYLSCGEVCRGEETLQRQSKERVLWAMWSAEVNRAKVVDASTERQKSKQHGVESQETERMGRHYLPLLNC